MAQNRTKKKARDFPEIEELPSAAPPPSPKGDFWREIRPSKLFNQAAPTPSKKR